MTSDRGARGAPRTETSGGLTVRRFRSATVASTPVFPALVPALLALPGETILHVHATQAFVPEAARLAAAVRRQRLVVHYHMDVGSTSAPRLHAAYKRAVLGPTLRRADRVIVLNRAQAQEVAALHGVGPDRIRVVANGVDDRYFTTASPQPIGSRPVRLLFVGRLNPQKDLPLLFAAVRAMGSQPELVCVGGPPGDAGVSPIDGNGADGNGADGNGADVNGADVNGADVNGVDVNGVDGNGADDKRADANAGGVDGAGATAILTELRRQAPPGVRLVGEQTADDVADWYGWADILVSSSHSEGMPLVFLEAMAAGLPIVSTDVAGSRETLAGVGKLVARTPEALAGAIEALAGDLAAREAMAGAGRAAVSGLRWPAVASEVAAVYEELPAARGPARV